MTLTVKTMDLASRKYHLMERVMLLSEKELDKMETLLNKEILDPEVENAMTQRALQSEKDIKEGKVYTIEEADARLNQKLNSWK
ncbi:MAG: hypothetical protein HC819_19725 [Cyclobacteriaceae bacterium]|nr:hypothetical protein [Cyclobacteriaceae bacterium]